MPATRPPKKRTRFCRTNRLCRTRARRAHGSRRMPVCTVMVILVTAFGRNSRARRALDNRDTRMPKPLVTALIVSYNVKPLLLKSLEALFAHADVPIEAVVVDNASTDGSAAAVASNFPDAVVL